MINKSVLLDILFNYFSLIIGGISGIIINIYVSYCYGPEGLGIFNQVYSFYVIFAQFAVGGIHLSALKHVSTWKGSSLNLSTIAWSSFLISLPISISFAFICYFLSSFLQGILPSLEVIKGIQYISVALIFFSCNKIMLFTLNALGLMRFFAFWQGVRFILIIVFIILLSYISTSPSTLSLSFTISEFILFIGLLLTNLYKIPYFYKGFSVKWVKIHFIFGIKGFFNGLLLEINTRVDILILGFLTNNKIVGIYSFASILIEGILGILMVIRNQINPIIANLLKDNKVKELQSLFKNISFYMYIFSFVAFIIAFFFYDFFFSFLLHLNSFSESKPFFLILLFGICAYSSYFIFENILLLSGHPGKQSLLSFYTTLTNLFLNILFIPIWGPYGSAFATALTLVLTIFYVKIMVRKYLGISMTHLN